MVGKARERFPTHMSFLLHVRHSHSVVKLLRGAIYGTTCEDGFFRKNMCVFDLIWIKLSLVLY